MEELLDLLNEYVNEVDKKYPILGEPTLIGFRDFLKKKEDEEKH